MRADLLTYMAMIDIGNSSLHGAFTMRISFATLIYISNSFLSLNFFDHVA